MSLSATSSRGDLKRLYRSEITRGRGSPAVRERSIENPNRSVPSLRLGDPLDSLGMSVGMDFRMCGSLPGFMMRSMAVLAIWAGGTRTDDGGVASLAERGMSLYPTSARSWPTLIPKRWAAAMIPMAMLSLAANTAVGRFPAFTSRSDSPAGNPFSMPWPAARSHSSGGLMQRPKNHKGKLPNPGLTITSA